MTNNTLSEKDAQAVFDILIEQLDVTREQLTPEARIMEDLGADSLDVVEIIINVEERFDITIPDDVSDKVSTVGDLLETLAEAVAQPRRRAG